MTPQQPSMPADAGYAEARCGAPRARRAIDECAPIGERQVRKIAAGVAVGHDLKLRIARPQCFQAAYFFGAAAVRRRQRTVQAVAVPRYPGTHDLVEAEGTANGRDV